MIEKLYSDFDAPIIIESSRAKTFFENEIDFKKLQQISGIKNYSKIIEETVVLKHENKWANAKLIGIEPSFLSISRMSSHMVDGLPIIYENKKPVGLIGASLLDKLEGFIRVGIDREIILIYAPKRNLKMSFVKSPFNTQFINLIGRFSYNKEINSEIILVPIETSKSLLEFSEGELSSIAININNLNKKFKIKQDLQNFLGNGFTVKTNEEKNKLIFQTSKSERLIVIIILIFIFILASFNLVASLTMLFIEKKEDINILKSMGANSKFIFRIFFYEGLLISLKGIIYGLIIGYIICFLQLQFGLLKMPNSFGEHFPINTTFFDLISILFIISILSFFASYFPVKMLLKRNGIN